MGTVTELTCGICNLGPAQGITVFRQNAKGVAGIWRCRAHVDNPPPPDVEEITDILEGRKET